jgi:peroxiredoxin
MEAMNLIGPQIEKAGAMLYGISPQTVQQSSFMADQHKLQPISSSLERKQISTSFSFDCC